jgi:hypothetical protein
LKTIKGLQKLQNLYSDPPAVLPHEIIAGAQNCHGK